MGPPITSDMPNFNDYIFVKSIIHDYTPLQHKSQKLSRPYLSIRATKIIYWQNVDDCNEEPKPLLGYPDKWLE